MSLSAAQLAHLNSVDFQEARQKGLRRALETRLNGPKCGARKRSGEGACKQPVSAPGKRCRYHGGATPKGNDWHRRQWPARGAPESRLKIKQKSLELRGRAAEARRQEMTPEEREKHEIRRRAMSPTSKAERAMKRQAKEARQLMLRPKKSHDGDSEELAALGSKIEELEAMVLNLSAQEEHAGTPDIEGDVFS